jgi:hypothetical protein
MWKTTLLLVALCFAGWVKVDGANSGDEFETWRFAVSGDSRNCGDVVMPAIASEARKHDIAFYWHLGDLRAIRGPDQDFIAERSRQRGKPTDLVDYDNQAWDDFIENQIKPWGDVPFFLGIGNHELVPPKTRAEFLAKFQQYLDQSELRAQRLKDDPSALSAKTYYHWMHGGIDFIYLDNASLDEFDAEQMKWLRGVIDRDRQDSAVRTLVVGMHKALPDSVSAAHSMNESPVGIESGRQVYQMLLSLQNEAHKLVYVLASHSHYFMDGIFNTAYWNSHGGVLPGWIIGTAGAERIPLPAATDSTRAAKTNVYGYLLATVNPEGAPRGSIQFDFEELGEGQIPQNVIERFTRALVEECFAGNRRSVSLE